MNTSNINLINDYNLYSLDTKKLDACYQLVNEVNNIKDKYINLKIATIDEIEQINKEFRSKDKPTNIISFPFEVPDGLPDDFDNDFLGDILISPEVLEKEAKEQNKNINDHWCHIFIHGLLHLIGYDHQNESQAIEMESLEIKILAKLEIKNPYMQETI